MTLVAILLLLVTPAMGGDRASSYDLVILNGLSWIRNPASMPSVIWEST
jgi:hypothetical protein